ncbi:hypothetical protein [Bacteroides graminisolvens]|uniref:hypothetical protein n=1 Tax=Bacteroides graminisolvens TaxID=477666 RepID=UPI0029C8B2B6|nr:hypothetical protein [Bacteroides graminisolvens]
MDIISIALSAFAIVLTIAMYFKHDKRLKKQEEKLNAYQLKKINEEESENRKALIRGNIVKGNKGSRVLKVFNSGKAIARNIRVEYLGDMENIIPRDDHFPYELLNPQDNSEIFLLLSEGASKLNIKLIWDDDFKHDNELIQVLTL